MKTFIFVRNQKYRPSTYYRIIQYLENTELINQVEICEYESNKYYTHQNNRIIQKLIYGLLIGYMRRILFLFKIYFLKDEYQIFVQREIFPRKVDFIAKKITEKVISKAKNVYWDFDDQIVASKEISNWEFALLSEKTTEIFVGNHTLKGLISKNYHDKTVVVNTTDKYFETFDFEKYFEQRKQSYDKKVTLVWLGTKSNIKYLQEVVPTLEDVSMKLKKQLEINVVSNAKIVPTKKSNLIINNITWTREEGFKQLSIAHIGLMPLEDSELTRGKCSFKAVQYMGAGLPIIISPVGMNKEIIDGNGYFASNRKQWENAVDNLSANKNNWEKQSYNSIKQWKKKFYSSEIAKKYIEKIESR